MRVAPWPDYKGNPIYEESIMQHPDGERFKVIFLGEFDNVEDQWRALYEFGHPSRLCLQVGDKGQAVVKSLKDKGEIK